jgi:hypothetical protein
VREREGRKEVGEDERKKKTHKSENRSSRRSRPSPKRQNPLHLRPQHLLKHAPEHMIRIRPLTVVPTIITRRIFLLPAREKVPEVPARFRLFSPSVPVCPAEVVVRPSTFRVREGVVGVGDGLEFGRCGFAFRFVCGSLGDAVRVGLEGAFAVGELDLVGGCFGGNAWEGRR